MDPRNAAKVTAPDLLEAFHEHAPHQTVDSPSTLRLFVVLTKGDDVVSASVYNMLDVKQALDAVTWHLTEGGNGIRGNGAFMITATDAPEFFNDAVSALEA